MASNLNYCLTLLEENSNDVKTEARKILLKLCNNIINHPRDSKYRRILLSNEIVSSKLLPAAGAIECLFEAGFVESDNGFVLPTNASLTGVQELCRLLSHSPTLAKPEPSPQTSKISQKPQAVKQQLHKKSFLDEIAEKFNYVLKYEDKSLHEKVKSILPLVKLQLAAVEKLRDIQREMKQKNAKEEVVLEDLILMELLSWFKFKFFKWVDSPECRSCGESCTYNRSQASSSPRISRIEIHKCKTCAAETPFPRYIDPEILLHTRRGRCGEWANCFTLICRALGYDARIVYDETDHVWTEIWSVAHSRWLHADSCENSLDAPLLYERGWRKQLSYVMAFSRDEVQDVTWRYTREFRAVARRRKQCSEEALRATMERLNRRRQSAAEGYSEARRRFVVRRRALELAGMLSAPPGCKKTAEEETEADGARYGGRTSGSLAWRLMRGEARDTKVTASHWTIPTEVLDYSLTYSIINDRYTSKNLTTDEILENRPKWQSGVESTAGGIFRKEEADWKMIYLARSAGSAVGRITWNFAVRDAARARLDRVYIRAIAKTFEKADVAWQLEGIFDGEEKSKIVRIEDSEKFETEELRGAVGMRLSAELKGGEGDMAWQHAQLFRQSLVEDREKDAMAIRIKLKSRS